MTTQEYSVRTTTAVTQGAATVMALVAVMALGLMGFAMGYAKAGQGSLIGHASNASMPGVASARVSLVSAGEGEMRLAAVEPAAPAPAPRARPAPVIAPVARVAESAAAPAEIVAEPQDAVMAPESSSAPVA